MAPTLRRCDRSRVKLRIQNARKDTFKEILSKRISYERKVPRRLLMSSAKARILRRSISVHGFIGVSC